MKLMMMMKTKTKRSSRLIELWFLFYNAEKHLMILVWIIISEMEIEILNVATSVFNDIIAVLDAINNEPDIKGISDLS